MALAATDQHVPAAQLAYQALHERIIKLQLEPGQAVSEKEVSDQIGVSRQPVREAFIRLAQQRLLWVRPQIGTFVSRLNVKQIHEAAFARVALECAAVREATKRADDDDFKYIRETILAHSQASKDKDFDLVYRLDTAFHVKLLELSGHPGLWQMVSQTRAHMARLRNLSAAHMPHTIDTSADYHMRILNAIEARDADTAAQQLKDHIESNLEFMKELIEVNPKYFETV